MKLVKFKFVIIIVRLLSDTLVNDTKKIIDYYKCEKQLKIE